MASTSRQQTGRLTLLLIGAILGVSFTAVMFALIYYTIFKWDHPWPRGSMSRITVTDPYGGEPLVIRDEAELGLVDVWLRASLQERHTRDLPLSLMPAVREIAIDLDDGRRVLLYTSAYRVDVPREHFVQESVTLELDDRTYRVHDFPVVLLTAGERAPSFGDTFRDHVPDDS